MAIDGVAQIISTTRLTALIEVRIFASTAPEEQVRDW